MSVQFQSARLTKKTTFDCKVAKATVTSELGENIARIVTPNVTPFCKS